MAHGRSGGQVAGSGALVVFAGLVAACGGGPQATATPEADEALEGGVLATFDVSGETFKA